MLPSIPTRRVINPDGSIIERLIYPRRFYLLYIFCFVPPSLINAQQKRENVQINGRFGAPLINRRRVFSFNKETSRRRGRRV